MGRRLDHLQQQHLTPFETLLRHCIHGGIGATDEQTLLFGCQRGLEVTAGRLLLRPFIYKGFGNTECLVSGRTFSSVLKERWDWCAFSVTLKDKSVDFVYFPAKTIILQLTMKCDACGLESDFSAAFFKERKAFRKSVRQFCPTCWTRRRQISRAWPQIGLMLAGIIGYVLLWLNVWPDLAEALSTIFLLNIFLILSIVPHELGHAIAGGLLGLRVFSVIVGAGKRIFKFNLFGVTFSFHWLPVSGQTQFAPRCIRWWRVKFLVTVLAGPAVNAIIALTIVYISRHHNGVSVPAQLLLIANIWILYANLVPYRGKTRPIGSDGLQIIEAFFIKREKIEQMHAARFVLEASLRMVEYRDIESAARWCKEGLALYPDNELLLNMSGTLCLDRCDYAQARELFKQLLQRESKIPGWRFIILNNMAYADALMGDPSLLPEADAYSEEAYRNIPWAYFAIGTRGTVLVEMKRYEEGIKLLKEAIEKTDDPFSKSLNTCNLSIAHARLGDYEQADMYLKLARQMDPHCSLLERAAAELRECQGRPSSHTSVARE